MTDAELRTVLADRLAAVRQRIADAAARSGRSPADVTLVAVTKYTSPEAAQTVLDLGVADLGESRPQSLWERATALPTARWHLIGHLQRNKIDRTAPLVALIHSVDSDRLLDALDAFGRKHNAPVPVLLEVNCSREEAKGGFAPDAVPAVGDRAVSLSGVRVEGLMTMAAHHDDPERCRPTFAELRELRDRLRASSGLPLPHLSMGMSNDYAVAVEEGATFVRVGSTLFDGLGRRMIAVTAHADGATLAVRAQPGAKKDAVVGEQAGALKVAVTAPPEDGRANAALVEVLKDWLGVRRSQVELLAGPTHRNKVFLIRGVTAEWLAAKAATAG